MSNPDVLMRESTEARYRLDHPDDPAGATVAGWLAAWRVARRVDPHAIPVPSPEVRAAMQNADIKAIEQWLTETWSDIEEAA